MHGPKVRHIEEEDDRADAHHSNNEDDFVTQLDHALCITLQHHDENEIIFVGRFQKEQQIAVVSRGWLNDGIKVQRASRTVELFFQKSSPIAARKMAVFDSAAVSPEPCDDHRIVYYLAPPLPQS